MDHPSHQTILLIAITAAIAAPLVALAAFAVTQ